MAMLAWGRGVVTSAPTHHSHQAPPCISISIITILAKICFAFKMRKNWILPHFVEDQNVLLVKGESKTIILTTSQMDGHPLLPSMRPCFVRGQNVLYGDQG